MDFVNEVPDKNGGLPVEVRKLLQDEKRADFAEVVVTNNAGKPVDINTRSGPEARLSYDVQGPHDKVPSTYEQSKLLSIQKLIGKPRLVMLQPGEKFFQPFHLLILVPQNKLVPGTYRVKAAFEYGGKRYESNEVKVEWPGNDKKK